MPDVAGPQPKFLMRVLVAGLAMVGLGACRTGSEHASNHVANENNEIKPDQVFPRENMNPVCGECHAGVETHLKMPSESSPCAICHDVHAGKPDNTA
jgi:hypothetical protein